MIVRLRRVLIPFDQLEFEGFSTEDATYGVDAQNADWFQQAVLSAESYLEYSSFSRSELISQLEFVRMETGGSCRRSFEIVAPKRIEPD